MHEVLVNRLGGLSLPRKSVVRLTDRPDMTLDVYRGRKTTIQPNSNFEDMSCTGQFQLGIQKLFGQSWQLQIQGSFKGSLVPPQLHISFTLEYSIHFSLTALYVNNRLL